MWAPRLMKPAVLTEREPHDARDERSAASAAVVIARPSFVTAASRWLSADAKYDASSASVTTRCFCPSTIVKRRVPRMPSAVVHATS